MNHQDLNFKTIELASRLVNQLMHGRIDISGYMGYAFWSTSKIEGETKLCGVTFIPLRFDSALFIYNFQSESTADPSW